MSFKGTEIVETMKNRKVVIELVCDVVVKNAQFMHYVRTSGKPLLLKALQTGGPKDEIEEMFKSLDAKMDFLFCFFKRQSDYLKPLRLMQNT